MEKCNNTLNTFYKNICIKVGFIGRPTVHCQSKGKYCDSLVCDILYCSMKEDFEVINFQMIKKQNVQNLFICAYVLKRV